MATNGPKISNGIVSNNPDFFARADPDVNNKYRQVMRFDIGMGTGESLVSSVNPMPVTSSPSNLSTSGTITASGSTITLSGTSAYGGVSVSINGTYNAVNFTLEGSSDNTNWYSILMMRQDVAAQASSTSGLLSNATRAWIAPTMGAAYIRVRGTGWLSGTANINIAAISASVSNVVTSVMTALTGFTNNFKNLDCNATGALLQTGATTIGSIIVSNTTAAFIYFKTYNKVTAATSADTPVNVYPIPPNYTFPISFAAGATYSAGFSYRCTTGVSDADNVSPTANACIASFNYI